MRITIVAVGKFKNSPEKEIYSSYLKRLPWKVQLKELDVKKGLEGLQLKQAESELILSAIPKSCKIIALDETGKNLSSNELAGIVSAWQNEGSSSIAFIIGGADGLDTSVRQKSDVILSFGKLTWPHMLVRPMLAEQIYRVYGIISGHPYHRQ